MWQICRVKGNGRERGVYLGIVCVWQMCSVRENGRKRRVSVGRHVFNQCMSFAALACFHEQGLEARVGGKLRMEVHICFDLRKELCNSSLLVKGKGSCNVLQIVLVFISCNGLLKRL